ncbi:MAG TPA: hypothetical protein DHV62_02810 [Elusimicrobia bacterium]|nr:hypothetical protein [Elusimicrobiota bacterium]
MNGCATVPKMEYVFPPAPARPKLKFLYNLRSEVDLHPQGRAPLLTAIWYFLLGREVQNLVLVQPQQVCAYDTRVYVTDIAQKKVVVFDFATKSISYIAVPGVPTGIAVDNEGRLYIAEGLNLFIKVYDRTGNFLYQFGGKIGSEAGQFSGPQGMVVDRERGLLYISDRGGNNRIAIYDLQGNFLYNIGQEQIIWVQYIATDNQGKIYLSESFKRTVLVYDRMGKFIRTIGEAGDTIGSFARPKGIAVDSDGNIYVADGEFDVIQVFSPEGRTNFFWIGTPPVRFNFLQGLYIDEKDRLYVVDTLNQRIQVYQYLK